MTKNTEQKSRMSYMVTGSKATHCAISMKSHLCLIVLLCLLVLPNVNAARFIDCTPEIKIMAKQLEHKGNINLTVFEIDRYTHDSNNGSFFWYKQDMCKYWKTRKGDCTDMAWLEKYMLESLGIRARLVYGFSDGYIGMHDWIEYSTDGKNWFTLEKYRFPNLRKRGVGIW
jgi:hypothetical protein